METTGMEPTDQLDVILPAVTKLVARIRPDQLDAPTPCDDFTVHDVIDHMIVLGTTFAHLFRGEEPPAITAPAVYGRVPSAEFASAMSELGDAVAASGAQQRWLVTPIGEMDGATFARVVAVDGLVHGWDLAVATGVPFTVDPDVVAAVDDFARAALSDELRAGGLFASATEAPADATTLESLAAFSGRTVDARWRTRPAAIAVAKDEIPTKMAVPGATARQLVDFGDASGYGAMAGEYFSLAAGTDIAPLLAGLDDDTCHAPHWGYMLEGEVIVTFVGGSEATFQGGELFFWPAGHSVRVTEDAEVILFSPRDEHVAVLDHMLDKLATT